MGRRPRRRREGIRGGEGGRKGEGSAEVGDGEVRWAF